MFWRKRTLLVFVTILGILLITCLVVSGSLTNKVRKVSDKTKLEVKQRDHFQCVICKSKRNLQIDHKTPLWKGGSNDTDNLQTMCASHHRQKSQKEMKEFEVFRNETLQKFDYRCSYCGERAPPGHLRRTFKTLPEHGGIYTQENLKTICKSCIKKTKAIKVNGVVVKEGKPIRNTDFTVKAISENKATFTNLKSKKSIVLTLKTEAKKTTSTSRVEGSVYYKFPPKSAHYCAYCSEPAYGWCHMRRKYVCEIHRRFYQGGTNWICP